MLQSIRDHTQGWIAGVIISLLILSFALWGIHSYIGTGGANENVANVNGQEITKRQVALVYERLRRQMQAQTNNVQLPVQAESAIKDRALQSIIETEVLKQSFLDQGYRISNVQLDSFIESLPEFQNNGRFSENKFRTVLESNLYNPGDFIDLVRTSLIIDQPRLGIIFSSFSLPKEVSEVTNLINQERDIQYLVLPYDVIKNEQITVPEEKIKTYYTDHQDLFKSPEQVSVDYVELNFNKVLASINPTDEQLKKYYNDNSASFTQAQTTETKNASPISKGSAQASVQKPKQTINTPSSANSAQSPKRMSTQHLDQASGVLPFDQVKDQVKKAYVQQKAEEKYSELREKLASISYEHPESLKEVANDLGLNIQSSSLFTADKGAKDISENTKVREAAFSDDVLNRQNNSDLIQLNSEQAIVLRVKTHSPARVLSLEMVKPKIIEALTKNERDQQTKELADQIQQKLSTGVLPEPLAASYQLTWKKAGFVKRNTKSVDPAILAAVFAMPKPQQSKSTFSMAKTSSGYVVIALNGVREGTTDPKNNQEKSYAEQIQTAQGLVEYELYKNSLIRKAKIKVEGDAA